MRWCFFSPGLRSFEVLTGDTRTTGGAEAQVARLAAALADLGHEVALIYGDGFGRGERQVHAGVACIDAAPEWRRPASLARFWRALGELSPDLLYARLPSDFLWMLGLFARRNRRRRFVYALANDLHCRAWTAYGHKRWFHAPVYWAGLRSAHAVAVQHHGQATVLAPSLRARSVHVPNLVLRAPGAARAFHAADFDAIWIAKIRPEKQLERFLDLAQALPELRFAVVGGFDPEMAAELQAPLRRRLGTLANLAALGPQNAEDVLSLVSRSRMLVNTSRAEGFPNTMLEAWSMGVPVVSLSVDPGGVITRERLGLVSGDAAALRRDVETLARDASLNQRLGTNGLAYVSRRHSLEAVCKALGRALPEALPALAATPARRSPERSPQWKPGRAGNRS